MMEEIYVPSIDDFAERLGALIDKDVKAIEVDDVNRFDKKAQSAIYITREDNLAAIARVSLDLAARMGACLAMLPAASAKEIIEAGALDEDLDEAYYEVMNILAGLLCKDDYPHVRLASVNACDPSLKEQFIGALVEPAVRLDVHLSIEDYGDGHFTLWTPKLI